jgi:hypothetical protein
MGVPNQGFKKPFPFERQKDSVLKLKLFESLSVCP